MLEAHLKFSVAELDFVGKKFFALKIGKMDQKCIKNSFFEYIEKFSDQFLL